MTGEKGDIGANVQGSTGLKGFAGTSSGAIIPYVCENICGYQTSECVWILRFHSLIHVTHTVSELVWFLLS